MVSLSPKFLGLFLQEVSFLSRSGWEVWCVLCECCKVFAEELPKRTQHAMQQKKEMRPILRVEM